MTSVGLNALSVAFELLIYYFFFHLFFGEAKYSKAKMAGVYLASGVVSLILSIALDVGYGRRLGYWLIIMAIGLCYRGQVFVKLFLPFLFQAFSGMVERCWSVLLRPYGNSDVYFLIGIILSNLTILLLIWLGYVTKGWLVKNDRYHEASFPPYYAILFLFPVCMIYVIDQYHILLLEADMMTMKTILPIIVLTMLIVLFFFFFDFLIRYQYEHKRLAILENQMALEQAYHEILLNKHQQFQGLRHDMQAHLNAIASLINNEHFSEALEYAQNQAGKLAAVAVVQTGHPLLDTILTIKKEQAQQQSSEIECYCSAVMPKLTIAIDDLASLLDNLLSNALEAVQDIEEAEQRTITCRLVQEKNYLHIIVRNNVLHQVNIIDNTIATTKANKAAHGFGLTNVKHIVKKYHGNYDLQCANGVFTVKVILPVA